MANRVSAVEVKDIITTTKADIQAFITAANVLVTAVLGSSTVLTTAQLKEIERWLSAHFIAMSGSDVDAGQVVEEEIGEARVKYAEGATTRNLGATRYGKQAMLLDTTGQLAAMGSGRATFRAVGLTIPAPSV